MIYFNKSLSVDDLHFGNGARHRVGAVLVLFYPKRNVIGLVDSLLSECGCVYIVDNSESDHDVFLPQTDGVVMVHGGNNIGLAKAYNLAVQRAKMDGVEYVVFFDQDSTINKGFVDCALGDIGKLQAEFGADNRIMGLRSGRKGENKGEVEMTIGSGLFVRVSDIVRVGGFDERRFVDGVDEEFCIRARKNGYAIWLTSDVLMGHEIGESLKVFNLVNVFQYSPFRVMLQVHHTRLLVAEYFFVFPLYVVRKVVWQAWHLLLMFAFLPGRNARLRALLKGILQS